jgi:hypothetical protein
MENFDKGLNDLDLRLKKLENLNKWGFVAIGVVAIAYLIKKML